MHHNKPVRSPWAWEAYSLVDTVVGILLLAIVAVALSTSISGTAKAQQILAAQLQTTASEADLGKLADRF